MSTVTVGTIERAIDEAFPTQWAEDWDRVGMLLGDPMREVTGVVLALDPTHAAIGACGDAGANVLVTHHPAALTMPSRIAPGGGAAGVLFHALDAGVALINAHTNLDRAPAAGTQLPARLGVAPLKPIERSTMPAAIVTAYVPPAAVERVRTAMSGAGAGRLGEYDACAFVSAPGEGSFTPREGARPTRGDVGATSTATEVRVEMVAPRSRVRGVVSAARAAHPYEEPLITVAEVAIVRSSARMGMLCDAGPDATLRSIADRAAEAFGVTPRVWGDADAVVSRVATATGSAGSLIGDVIASGAQALVAGEVRYHDALDAVENGLSIVEVGHDVSEWPLVELLREVVAGIDDIDQVPVVLRPATPGWWTP